MTFDEEWWATDLARTTPVGRKAARRPLRVRAGRRSARRPAPCEADGRDGTKLERCFKVYLPRPAGRFGMVLRIEVTGKHSQLRYLAFGVRHQPKGSHAETVYEVAHRRLHG